jgi:hypothetical protein
MWTFFLLSLFYLLLSNAFTDAAQSQDASIIPSHHPPPVPDTDRYHSAMLGRIEASIMGESALIDRATGRVFWEGGSSLTLYESLVPRFETFGVEHAVATLLSVILLFGMVGLLVAWIRQITQGSDFPLDLPHPLVASILWNVLVWTPKVESKWLLIAVMVVSFLESYNCPTRRFLTNAISSSSDLEAYVDNLRAENPIVTWKVKCFHHERRKITSVDSLIQWFRFRPVSNSTHQSSGDMMAAPIKSAPIWLLTKKVVTHQASAMYKYQR